MAHLPRLSKKVRDHLLDCAMGAADWFGRTQCKLVPGDWDANRGRFVYTRHRPSGRQVWGLAWTQARGILVLATAYQVSKQSCHRQAAELAADYLRGMQQTDSCNPLFAGIIWEELPYSNHVYVRDASEAAETFCCLYRLTRDAEWLWRAERYYRWYLGHGANASAWPLRDVKVPSGKQSDVPGSYQIGNGKFLYRLWQATHKQAILTHGLKPIVRRAISEFVSPEGGLYHNPRIRSAKVVGKGASHHVGRGSQAHLTVNDDGAGTALLGAYLAYGDRQVWKTLERYAAWILLQKAPFATFTSYVSMANFLLDMYRQTHRDDYLQWVTDNLDKGLLHLRIKAKRDPDHGGFLGEDERPSSYWGGKPTDYVCTRTNAYAAMLLFKLAAPKHWCCGYSAFGWAELKPWSRSPKR